MAVIIGMENQAKSLTSGEYNLYLSATEGSHRGTEAEGIVTLVAATKSDRSPRTGEIAKDGPEGPPLLRIGRISCRFRHGAGIPFPLQLF
jgi:hypothetical protein